MSRMGIFAAQEFDVQFTTRDEPQGYAKGAA